MIRWLVIAAAAFVSAFGPDVAVAQSSASQVFRPTPFVIRGVRVDPTQLSVSEAPVRRRGVVASGRARHAATASLTAPMQFRGPAMNFTAPVGTILHRVEFVSAPSDPLPGVAVWCGTLGQKTIFGGDSPPTCFIEGDPGLRGFLSSEGRSWLVTSKQTGGAPGRADRLEYQVSEESLLGELTVDFEVTAVRRDEVQWRLVARQGRQTATVAVFFLPIVDGAAVVPLWSHRLRMQVTGDTVSTTITADGDGRGPYDR